MKEKAVKILCSIQKNCHCATQIHVHKIQKDFFIVSFEIQGDLTGINNHFTIPGRKYRQFVKLCQVN